MKNKFTSNKLAVAVLTLPAILLFTIVVAYPALQSVYKSLFDWDGLNPGTFIFLDNYTRLFQDSKFKTSIYNGLVFTVIITVFQIAMGTILALLIANEKLPGRKFFRSVFFVPVVLSATITCQLWVSVLDGQNGMLNKLFETLGMSYRQDWLGGTSSAIFIMAVVNAWQYMGYHMVILYAAIKGIPSHYHEAARIDGANKVQEFFRITRPLLSEAYKMCLIMAVPGGLKAFEQMYIMTRGGPGTSSYTLSIMIYSSTFGQNEFGYGCSIAVVLVLQCLIALLVINRFVAKDRIAY